MQFFKHTAELKELYSKHPHTHYLDSTINIITIIILSYFSSSTHVSSHLSIWLISSAFQSKLQYQYTFSLNASTYPSLRRVQYLLMDFPLWSKVDIWWMNKFSLYIWVLINVYSYVIQNPIRRNNIAITPRIFPYAPSQSITPID